MAGAPSTVEGTSPTLCSLKMRSKVANPRDAEERSSYLPHINQPFFLQVLQHCLHRPPVLEAIPHHGHHCKQGKRVAPHNTECPPEFGGMCPACSAMLLPPFAFTPRH